MVASSTVAYGTDDAGNKLTTTTYYKDYSCAGRTRRDTTTEIVTSYRPRYYSQFGMHVAGQVDSVTPDPTTVYVTKTGQWSRPVAETNVEQARVKPDTHPAPAQAPVSVVSQSEAEDPSALLDRDLIDTCVLMKGSRGMRMERAVRPHIGGRDAIDGKVDHR